MLTLRRRDQEEILIRFGTQEVRLKVLHITDNYCKLGFEADRSVQIVRREVLEREDEYHKP